MRHGVPAATLTVVSNGSATSGRFRIPSGISLVHGLCGAWTVAVLAFLYIPILVLIAYSFNDSRYAIAWEGFTTRWYGEVWRDRLLVAALQNSLKIAAVTTLTAMALGVGTAWLLHRYRYPMMRLMTSLMLIPIVIPEIIMGISLLILFAALGMDLGFWTVVIAHVTFCFPFVVVAIQARLDGIDPHLEEAALDLGATPIQAFFRVIVPYLMPAIVSGALMAFTLSMDEVIVTYFTAGPESRTLPLEVFGRLRKGLSPSINAISAIFIVATAVLVVLSEGFRRRRV